MTGRTNALMGGGTELTIVSWGGGSGIEIANMLDAHYNGITIGTNSISIDISDYWSVGDTRTVSLSAIASGTTGESQSAQTINLIIIGLDHDTLATTNGTRTKAAITVQTKNCLTTTGYMNADYTSSSYAVYTDSKRRSWCNSEFKNALPSWLQNLIKPVTKYTNRFSYSSYSSYRTHTSSTESCFLLSGWEVFGCQNLSSSGYGSLSADGTQYKYMETQSNRKKYLGTGTSGNRWWTRTSFVSSGGDAYFINCNTVGSYNDVNSNANYTHGIAPGFSL
jgi:hypothetical protein